MKRTVLGAMFAIVLMTGCSLILGSDGKAYVSLDWYGGYELYTSGLSSSGGFPADAQGGVEYSIAPGSYYFSYYLHDPYDSVNPDSSWWDVSYTITVNAGKLLEDGADKHFVIYCEWNGPSGYSYSRIDSKGLGQDSIDQSIEIGASTLTIHAQRRTSLAPSTLEPMRR